jgi:hypothetical protein
MYFRAIYELTYTEEEEEEEEEKGGGEKAEHFLCSVRRRLHYLSSLIELMEKRSV